jgi:hypothetical protein
MNSMVPEEVPEYQIKNVASSMANGWVSETARLHFLDAFNRPVAVYCQRQYPIHEASGVGMLHCVGGAQTINPQDLDFWNAEGHAAASFDWQIGEVAGRTAKTNFPCGVRAQHEPTDKPEHAVMPIAISCGRAVLDWLSRSPGVDPEKLGVCGISWGGYLTWLLAAYDERIRIIVPAFGCGGTLAGKRAPSNHGRLVQQVWLDFWEPQHLAQKVKVPVCYLSATNDFFGYPEDAETLLAKLTGPVVRDYLPNADHSLCAGQSALARAFVRHHLLGGPPLPETPRLQEIHAGAESQEIWWTTSRRPSPHRCWHRGLPPNDGDSLAFRRIQMPDGITISSPLEKSVNLNISDDSPAASPRLPGVGWRWETGSTQFHSNSARIDPTDQGLSKLTPARPETEDPVLVLFQVPSGWTEVLSAGENVVIHWSANARPEVTLCLDDGDPMEVSGASSWSNGQLTIFAKDPAQPTHNIDWARVGRIRILCHQSRAPFLLG